MTASAGMAIVALIAAGVLASKKRQQAGQPEKPLPNLPSDLPPE